jgi:hypothetical protein
MSRRITPRTVTVVGIVVMVASTIGFVTAMMLNAFLFDEFNAYGEVSIPGSGTVRLPAGEATVSLHTLVIGKGGGLPVPKMSIDIVPPAGVPDPVVVQDIGGVTTINSDAHIRVWRVQIPVTGDYVIKTDGTVGGYANPSLAFGHDTRYGHLPVAFAVSFGLGAVVLIGGRGWAAFTRRPQPDPVTSALYAEALNTLVRLRDSGALSAEEFEAEKQRLLQGY